MSADPNVASPAVSVIIATYNWSAALRCALESVRRQTLRPIEVIVVGDGCTDDSAEVVASMNDPRIQWHNLPFNTGSQASPNNHGIDRASSDWIAYHGHDDVWHPDHLATLVAAATDRNAAAAAATLLMYGPPGTGVFNVAGSFAGSAMAPTDFVPPTGLLHRRDLMDLTGPWREADSIALPVDCDFLKRLAKFTAVVPTNALTAFKFNAAARRDAYVHRDVSEQRAMLDKLEGPEFRHHELTFALRALASNQLGRILMPDTEGLALGELARNNRKFKGVEPRFQRDDLRICNVTLQFGVEDQRAPHEWHAIELDSARRPFRWTGPAPRAFLDYPIVRDRDLDVRLHLRAVTREVADRLAVRIDGHTMPTRRVENADGTFHVEFRAGAHPGAHLNIELDVMRTVRPSEAGINADMRALGVAVWRCEVTPAID